MVPCGYICGAWRLCTDQFLAGLVRPFAGRAMQKVLKHIVDTATDGSAADLDLSIPAIHTYTQPEHPIDCRANQVRAARHLLYELFECSVIVMTSVAPAMMCERRTVDVVRNLVEHLFPEMPASAHAPRWISDTLARWVDGVEAAPRCAAMLRFDRLDADYHPADEPAARDALLHKCAAAVRARFGRGPLAPSWVWCLVGMSSGQSDDPQNPADVWLPPTKTRVDFANPMRISSGSGVTTCRSYYEHMTMVWYSELRVVRGCLGTISAQSIVRSAVRKSKIVALLKQCHSAVASSGAPWSIEAEVEAVMEAVSARASVLIAANAVATRPVDGIDDPRQHEMGESVRAIMHLHMEQQWARHATAEASRCVQTLATAVETVMGACHECLRMADTAWAAAPSIASAQTSFDYCISKVRRVASDMRNVSSIASTIKRARRDVTRDAAADMALTAGEASTFRRAIDALAEQASLSAERTTTAITLRAMARHIESCRSHVDDDTVALRVGNTVAACIESLSQLQFMSTVPPPSASVRMGRYPPPVCMRVALEAALAALDTCDSGTCQTDGRDVPTSANAAVASMVARLSSIIAAP
jgi:hypothetical protein